jgi:nickel superoxide dismutase
MIEKFLLNITAQAHCDIPCGIYEPTPAKIAAKTVQRMAEQITALKGPEEGESAHQQFVNSIQRRIAIKETHAELCKKELNTLWTDFFKQEHLVKFPRLHDTFWKATKLCSKNKQEVNVDAAKELCAAVDEVAKMFYEAKGYPERYDAYQKLTDKLY